MMTGHRLTDASVSPAQAIVVRAIYRALADHGEPAPAALGLPRGTLAVRRTRVTEAYSSFLSAAGVAATRRTLSDRLRRYGAQLLQQRVIHRDAEWIWLIGRNVRIQRA